jgi:hypothetical protein
VLRLASTPPPAIGHLVTQPCPYSPAVPMGTERTRWLTLPRHPLHREETTGPPGGFNYSPHIDPPRAGRKPAWSAFLSKCGIG